MGGVGCLLLLMFFRTTRAGLPMATELESMSVNIRMTPGSDSLLVAAMEVTTSPEAAESEAPQARRKYRTESNS